MASANDEAVPADGFRQIEVDPFGFTSDIASAIQGLHGEGSSTDPLYVFHTPYIADMSGFVEARIKFTDLQATNGRIRLIVHSLEPPHNRVRLAASEMVALTSIAGSDGEVVIAFDATPGRLHAVMGNLSAPTTAAASHLQIIFHNDPTAVIHETRVTPQTHFEAESLKQTSAMAVNIPPTLAKPYSQACTTAQLRDPIMQQWVSRLGLSGPADRHMWETVFIAQALQRYGMLASGARGLGLGQAIPALGPLMAKTGCTVVVPADSAPERAGVPEPARTELGKFDFLWSSNLSGLFPTVAGVIDFILNTSEYLKLGGVAVHIFDVAMVPPEATVPGNCLTANHLGQLALAILGRNGELAQLNLWTDPGDTGPTSFGLILRRG